MITLRRSEDRGHTDHGWLDSRHTFSFSSYQDPAHMGFGPLRVINQDRVAPGQGFGSHPHRDMEILSIVLEGGLEHKDSLGSGSVLRPGDIQLMSAGTGVVHSEFNASKTEPVHFLQIWIEPTEPRTQPAYRERTFADDDFEGTLRCIVSGDERAGSLAIGRDVAIYRGMLTNGQTASASIDEGRGVWVQVIDGEVTVEGETLRAGDGAAISAVARATLQGVGAARADVLVFDLD